MGEAYCTHGINDNNEKILARSMKERDRVENMLKLEDNIKMKLK